VGFRIGHWASAWRGVYRKGYVEVVLLDQCANCNFGDGRLDMFSPSPIAEDYGEGRIEES